MIFEAHHERRSPVVLTGIASAANSTQALGSSWAIGIGVVVLVLGALIAVARKYGGRGQ